MTDRETRTGLLHALAAYLIWGLLPLFFKLLGTVSPLQILAHRILWSLVFLLAIVAVLRRFGTIRAAARGRVLLILCASAVLISVNWLVNIWAVGNARVLEASIGYFMNPLVNVALGVLVLRERIRPVQAAAVALAAAGVLALALGGGALWISVTLAVSFGLYGLLRKTVAIDALGGLLIETLLLAPVAAGVLAWAWWHGTAAWGGNMRLDALLAFSGVVTAIPLLLFASAARRLKYTTLGLLQYIAPAMAFAQAVFLFGEPLRPVYLVTLSLICAGCALYAWDSVRAARAGSDNLE